MALFTITAFLAISGTYGLAFRKTGTVDMDLDTAEDSDSDEGPGQTPIGCEGTTLFKYGENVQLQRETEMTCQQERAHYSEDFEQDLNAGNWKDVQVLYQPPTAEQAAKWQKKVIVVSEGMWRMTSDRTTHFYNVASMEVPNLARFILDPLKEAGSIKDAEIIIAKERPITKCSGSANLKVHEFRRTEETQKYGVTYEQLMKECKSGLEILPSVFPEVDIKFKDGVPFCWRPGVCEIPAESEFKESTTVLVIPMAKPVGWQYPRDRNPYCDNKNAMAARAWVHGTTKGPEKEPDQITLIVRGPDIKLKTEEYTYERPTSAIIQNWEAIEEAVTPWAKEKGLTVKRVVLETQTFAEQIETIRKTKILVGHEGAGLAHMMYFEDPKKSGVLEIQDGERFLEIERYGEFPTLARNVGVPLAFQTFNCGEVPSRNANPKKVVEALERLLPELQ